MLENLRFFILWSLRQCASCIDKSFSPPGYLFRWSVIIYWSSFKVLNDTFFSGLIFLVEQFLHGLELKIKVFQNVSIFLFKFSSVIFQFLLSIFYSLNLFIQNLHVFLVISRYVMNRVFRRYHSMLLMGCWIIDTINA